MSEFDPNLSRQVELILSSSDNELARMCEELTTYIIDDATAINEANLFLQCVSKHAFNNFGRTLSFSMNWWMILQLAASFNVAFKLQC